MRTVFLIEILIVLLLIISTLLVLFIKDVLNIINKMNSDIRKFITENSGFFKISFIIFFFLEQIAFILILNKLFDISKWAGVVIAIFALIVVTTSSFQVFIWEHKYYHSKQQLHMINRALEHFKLAAKKYDDILTKFKENLKEE